MRPVLSLQMPSGDFFLHSEFRCRWTLPYHIPFQRGFFLDFILSFSDSPSGSFSLFFFFFYGVMQAPLIWLITLREHRVLSLCSYCILNWSSMPLGVGRVPYDSPCSHFSICVLWILTWENRCNQKRTLINSHHLPVSVHLPTSVHVCSASLGLPWMNGLHLYKASSSTCRLDSVCPCLPRDLSIAALSSLLN